MVKLSIIMPVFNAAEYLEMSLNSIIQQTIDDYEVVIIDDGSTDNSKDIIGSFIKEHDNFKYISQKNSGSGKARNNGIKSAKGKYLAFLDADDKYLDKTALEKMYNLAQNYDADVVAANLKRINKKGVIEENYAYNDTLFTYFDKFDLINPWEYGIPWAFYKNIYKKSFLEENDIFFPNLLRGQDPVFLAKVLTNVDKIPVVNRDLYGYNHSASGGVNIKVQGYDKVKDYVQHFIDTFNILDKAQFKHIRELYKKEFIDYLNFRQNYKDETVKKVVKEILPDNIFNKTDYGYFIVDMVKNGFNKKEDNNYNLIKYCIFEESMIEGVYIDSDRLYELSKISKKTSNNNEFIKSSFFELKQIEEYTFDEKRKLSSLIGRYKNDIKYFIKMNNDILNSKSWKLTSYLRSIKHKF